MQGRNTRFTVVVATAGLILGGCTVNNYPAQPESPGSPGSSQAQSQQKVAPPPKQQQTAPTAQSVKPPAPTTARAPAPVQQPKPAQPPAGAAEDRSYTIKPGDNLWNISKAVYGDPLKYQRILDANPGLNPDNMKPGTKIVIP